MAEGLNNPISKAVRRRLIKYTPWVLLPFTLAMLLSHIPSRDLMLDYGGEMLVTAFLTGVALFFGALLTEGELSPAHAIGIMAFLALPEEAVSTTMWALFAGGISGGVALILRARAQPVNRRRTGRRWRNLIFITARVTVSFYAASSFYLMLDAPLPIDRTAWDFSTVVYLVIYSFVYVTLYLSIYLLEAYCNHQSIRQMIQSDVSQIGVILLLPIPFAILTAEIKRQLSVWSQIISILSLTLIILGLHALSRSEQRLRRQLNELRTLSVVTRAMRAHLDMDTLLKTIYLQVAHLLETTNFTVMLYDLDKKEQEFPLVMRRGREGEGEPETWPMRYANGLADHVLKTETPLLISQNVHQIAQDMRLLPPREPVYSWLGVPLLAGGHALGVISVLSDDPNRHFDQNDLRLLNIVAASASIAIENAQLYRQQTERVEQLATMNNIAALLSGTLSPETVVDTVITSASTISQGNAVAVYLMLDENVPTIRSAGFSDMYSMNPPQSLLLSDRDRPIHRQLPIAIPDITTDRRAPRLREMMAREGMSALVELPLFMGENDIGVLVVYFKQPQTFTGERLELLRTFATQAAQAINNANTFSVTDKAFQRSIERLLALASTGSLLASTVDLKTICEIVLQQAVDVTRVPAGLVALYDDDRHLRIMANHGPAARRTGVERRLEDHIERGVLHIDQPYVVRVTRDEMQDHQIILDAALSQISIPMVRSGEILGVIVLESERAGHFGQDDSHFMAQIATQTLIAIDNARLFQRITEARDRLQVILDAMDEAIILIDANGKVALANPRIKLIGLKPGDLIDHSVTELISNPDLKLHERMGFDSAQKALAIVNDLSKPDSWYGYTSTTYTVHNEQGGTVYIQRYVIPVHDEKKAVMGALLVFYNKTEENELNRAREEFSRMLVHDLRSPLTAVTTSLRLLRELVPAESDFRSVVETTTDASRRAIRKLLNRVDSLLDISKMESGRLSIDTEIVDLAPLADSVCVELAPLAHELEISLKSEVSTDFPPLNIDGDKVERLLLNLVDNALKYSPAESIVAIRAYPPGHDGTPSGFIRVEVADQGPGIPPDYKERLFDSFVQVEGRQKVRRGVGLGLTFCKLVTEAHGGKIWIEDNPGGGSIFAFTLPIAETTRFPEDEDEYPVGEM